MKSNPKEQKPLTQKETMKQVQKLLEERGRKALEMARKEMLQEKIECKEAQEALYYFLTEYWQDLARPTLLSLACEAVGGDPDVTIPIAIPLSLISGGIDIHDDIIDQSEIKKSRPTVLGKFGREVALLVGDALIFKGFTLLHEASEKGVPAEKIPVISGIVKRMFLELGDAEAMELGFRKRFDVLPKEYLKIIRRKAADVEAHTHISAILGNGTAKEIGSLSNYGRILGMLILIGDDNADVLNTEELLHRIGKEHLPLPLLYVLSDPKTKPQVITILKKENLTKSDAEAILRLVYDGGAFSRVEEIMENLIQEGISRLRDVRYHRTELALLIKSTYPK